MYRDFSNNSKIRMLGLVTEVENDKISDFTDWVGDRWYDFESWIGQLNVKNYLNNVNIYHKKVIDKNNTTKDTIEKIFSDVMSVDSSYQTKLSNVTQVLQRWQRYIDEMSRVVCPENGCFRAEYMSSTLDKTLENIESIPLDRNEILTDNETIGALLKIYGSSSKFIAKLCGKNDKTASNNFGLAGTAFSYFSGLHTFYTTNYTDTLDAISGPLGLVQVSGSAWTGYYKYLEKSLNSYQSGRLGKVWQGKVGLVSLIGNICGFTKESIDTYKVFMDENSETYQKVVQVLENTNSGLDVGEAAITVKWGTKELTRTFTGYQWDYTVKGGKIIDKAGTILAIVGVSIDTVIGGVNKYHEVTQDGSLSMNDIGDVGMAASVKGLTSIVSTVTLGLSDALFDLSGKSDQITEGIKDITVDPMTNYAVNHPISSFYIKHSQGLKEIADNKGNSVIERVGVSALAGIGMIGSISADAVVAPAISTVKWLSSGWDYLQNSFTK